MCQFHICPFVFCQYISLWWLLHVLSREQLWWGPSQHMSKQMEHSRTIASETRNGSSNVNSPSGHDLSHRAFFSGCGLSSYLTALAANQENSLFLLCQNECHWYFLLYLEFWNGAISWSEHFSQVLYARNENYLETLHAVLTCLLKPIHQVCDLILRSERNIHENLLLCWTVSQWLLLTLRRLKQSGLEFIV